MNKFTITEDFIIVENPKTQTKKYLFAELKSVKIIFHYSMFQKLKNFLFKFDKKSYKLNISFLNNNVQSLKISTQEKDFLKPKLETIKKYIENHKKKNDKPQDNTNGNATLIVA
jgi:ERCC4-related helicase